MCPSFWHYFHLLVQLPAPAAGIGTRNLLRRDSGSSPGRAKSQLASELRELPLLGHRRLRRRRRKRRSGGGDSDGGGQQCYRRGSMAACGLATADRGARRCRRRRDHTVHAFHLHRRLRRLCLRRHPRRQCLCCCLTVACSWRSCVLHAAARELAHESGRRQLLPQATTTGRAARVGDASVACGTA